MIDQIYARQASGTVLQVVGHDHRKTVALHLVHNIAIRWRDL